MKINISQEDKIPLSGRGVGLILEDANYALDGGLYAELLENRNFEAKSVWGKQGDCKVEDDGGYAWEPYPKGAKVAMKVKTDRALFSENPHYLRIETEEDGAGIQNKAYGGIYLAKDMGYKISFFVRSYNYKGAAIVGVYQNGTPLLQKKVKIKSDGEWHRFAFRLKSKTDAEGAEFAFTLNKCGIVHVDCFSMMPENAVLGVFRRDLVNYMKELKPEFLRFPDGCAGEENGLENRYPWKNSIGQVERRKQTWNRLAVHAADERNGYRSEFCHYGQTLGVGYYEYFRLCEYLGTKPFPAVSLGSSCPNSSAQCAPLEGGESEAIQDALDAVEFANGGVDTVWGRVRAEMGHPQPFGLEYLCVTGGQSETDGFSKQFELFEKCIHEKYPDLKIIGTGEGAGKRVRKNSETNFTYAAEECFHASPEWLYAHTNVFDSYPRGAKVYAGTYAPHALEKDDANAWDGALSEAAFMTGMERNADVVVLSSYAPLFARLGYTQWNADMIWFDGKSSYASAHYYVQQLYSLYTGNFSLKTTVEAGAENMYASATERDGMTFVKIVNAGDEERQAEIEGEVGELVRILCMSGERGDYNTLQEPDKIIPRDVAPASPNSAVLPPRSFQVLVFKK